MSSVKSIIKVTKTVLGTESEASKNQAIIGPQRLVEILTKPVLNCFRPPQRLCAGVLYSKKLILTTRKCVENRKAERLRVLIEPSGTQSNQKQKRLFDVKEVQYQLFIQESENRDIAILRLEEILDIDLNQNIVLHDNPSAKDFRGLHGFFWSNERTSIKNVMQVDKIGLDFSPPNKCSAIDKSFDESIEICTMIGSSLEVTKQIKESVGGPAMAENELIGLMSRLVKDNTGKAVGMIVTDLTKNLANVKWMRHMFEEQIQLPPKKKGKKGKQ